MNDLTEHAPPIATPGVMDNVDPGGLADITGGSCWWLDAAIAMGSILIVNTWDLENAFGRFCGS